MALVWVKAGACGQETTIEARRIDMTHVAVEFTTTCEHIQKLAEVLKTLDIAHEMSVSLLETTVYRLASQYVCRNSCVVPAAILKALEVEANIFSAAESQIAFVDSIGG
ncbi:MAG: DUF6951 family protein [Anaerolineae bacterium]